jgi:hypothetical protein
MPPGLDDAEIRRYLLGVLPEPQSEVLEEAYLRDPEVLDRVRDVENDLLDDYAGGRLEGAEKQAFEARYLAAAFLRERVVAARALRLATAGASPRPAPVVLVDWRRRRWGGLLALAAGLLVAVLVFWLRPSPPARVTTASPPAPLASPPAPAASPPAPAATAFPHAPGPRPGETASPLASPRPAEPHRPPLTGRMVLALSPILLRGQGGPAEFRIRPGTGIVVLELEGAPASLPSTGHPLQVTITTVEGRRAWSGPTDRLAGRARPGVLAAVAVPADRLPPADYLVTLSAGGETLNRYYLRVPAP